MTSHHRPLLLSVGNSSNGLGMTIQVRVRVTRRFQPMGAGVGTVLHPWVAPAPDSHRDGFVCGFSFAPVGDPTGAQKNPNNIFSPVTPAAQLS
jgi:hypothetical protein